MIKDSNQLEKLLASFRSAEQRVNKVLFQTNPKTVQQLQISLDRELKTVTLQLSDYTKKWANNDLKTAYNEGAKKIGELPSGKLDGGLKQDAVLNPYIELTDSVRKASEQTRQLVNEVINKSLNNGTTSVYDVKKALQAEMLKQNGSMVVKYDNGAKMPLNAYSSMVARTARIEASNTGSINRCQAMNYDLVKCTVVPNCCPYCKRFEGKVYSISGKDSRFPSLYGPNSPFQNGYNIMHPNCRHEFLPYVEPLQTAEQLEKDIKNSVVDQEQPKTKKVFDTYNKQQAKLRQYREEYKEFNQLKSVMGANMPYTTLGGYRRSRRAKSNAYSNNKSNLSNTEIIISNVERSFETIADNSTIEKCTVIAKNGKAVNIKGSDSYIVFDKVQDFEDSTIIHNHPTEVPTSFGKDDFMFLLEHQNIKCLQAVDKWYTYKVSVVKKINMSYNEAYINGLDLKIQSEDFDGDTQHYVFEWLKKEGYVDYEKTKRNK